MDNIEQITEQACRRIRELRKDQAWSLDELATRSGVSRSMLSEIERGQANPTLAVALKIAKALEISLAQLVEEPHSAPRIDVIRAQDREYVFHQDEDSLVRTLSPLQLEKDVEFYEVRLASEASLRSAPHYQKTREFLTVSKGQVQVVSGDSVESLKVGDSATYRADVEHAIVNLGRGEAVVFLVVIYP